MAAAVLTTCVAVPPLHPDSPVVRTLRRRSPLRPLPRALICLSSKKESTSFTDRILDYIEGGPKLRRWYGAPDLFPKDGAVETKEDESQEGEVRQAVLVTDGESELGQMVILSLILKRARVKALVKNKQAVVDSFGTYVEPLVGDKGDKSYLTKALRGVRAIICPSDDGFFSDNIRMKGVEHIILLSQLVVYRCSSGLQAIMTSKARELAERDEKVVIASGIPYTIIRTGTLQNNPGGQLGFDFKEGAAAKGKLSKEDAARMCVDALDSIPHTGLIFEVANGEEKVSDWKEWFDAANKRYQELQENQRGSIGSS